MARREVRDIEVRFRTVNADKAIRDVERMIAAERKEFVVNQEKARKLISQEKNLANQRVQIAKKEAREIAAIRAKSMRSGNATGVPSVANAPRMAKSINSISFGRKRSAEYKRDLANKMYEGRMEIARQRTLAKAEGLILARKRRFNSKFSKTGAGRIYQGASFDPYYKRNLSNYRSPSMDEAGRIARTNSFSRTGVSGNYRRITAANSMFATGASTPAMDKVNASFDSARTKRFNSVFSTGQAQTFGMQGPHGASKFLKSRAEGRSKAFGDVRKGFFEVRNSLGSIATVATQAVGELTMFAGALTMVGFMATAAMTKLMALGDAFATSETNFLVGAGFRQSLIRKGGVSAVAGFDRANELSRKYSGLDEFSSGAQLARATTRFREMGGSTSESSMKNLVTAAYGASAITGDTADKTMSKVLEVAKKGKGTDKLGLAELKLTKNMDENLNIIANAIKKDPIASTILKRGTIASAMQRIRSAPAQLMGKVRGLHGEQTSRIFNRVGNSIMNAAESPKVVAAWSQVLTNLENVVKVVFTDENMEKAAIGAAQWAAELTVAGGNLINSFRWFLENSETVLTWIERIATVWAGITAFKIGAGIVKFGLDLIALKGSIGNAIGTLNGATGSLVKSIGGVAFGVASALAGIWMAVNDFKEGKANAEKWGVGKTNAGVSSFIGGTSSGAWGAANNALKWGAIGAGIGSFIPVVGTGVGAAIGAGFGAITGYAGGKGLSQAAHESMYGPINPPGAYHNSATANAQANYMPAWNNPNAKVIVIPGELTLNSSLHLSEQFMTGGAGES